MKVKVSQKGLLIPKKLLAGATEADVRKKNGQIVVVPIRKNDPIFRLGKHPVKMDVTDAAENHDRYLYGE
ncbi:MAG: hypothetical protein JWM21_2548 [Acidobacteria bacterium]|nr:hypothetical protein [Acidobacteriota bacterium]